MFLTSKDIDRFWSGVNIRGSDECWFWPQYCGYDGYGRIRVNGKKEGAHRVVWTIVNGLIPELFEGLPSFICHHCDNPPCCNPRHLFLGNQKINIQDCVNKGRVVRLKGVENPAALLTGVQVKEIKVLLRDGGLTQQWIAERYDLTQRTVRDIKSGKTWSYLKEGDCGGNI